MSSRLADRLHAAREALFVGRASELALFEEALDADVLPFFVLHIFGPGGVGKTSLLRAFERSARQRHVAAHYIDARDLDATPEAFEAALRHACGLDASAAVPQTLEREGGRVLLIDTWETISSLDRWLREQFLPDLPDSVLVVLAGRELPPRPWRVDPGWRQLARIVSLRNLDGATTRAYLSERGVPAEQHTPVLAFTHGHPLATSLVADVLQHQPTATFQPEQAPGIIRTLLGTFVQTVPSPAHRAALEACALVRFVTEGLLHDLLDAADVQPLFAWLRDLSFVDAGERGLFLHDLARDVLAADVRWRNPDWHAELHRRARHAYTTRLQQSGIHADRGLLSDFAFLLRDNPLVRPLFQRLRDEWAGAEAVTPDAARPADLPALVAMTERHEGAEASGLLRAWIDHGPERLRVYRRTDGTPQGFQLTLALTRSDEPPVDDPAVRRVQRLLRTERPLRAGEHALLFRFWMDRDSYQALSPVQSLIALDRIRRYLGTPGLAATFVPCQDAGFWTPIFQFGGLERLPAADFEVGERTYAVFGHDWRTAPPSAWLDALAARGAGLAAAEEPAAPAEPLLVLSQDTFADAVRDALHEFHRPDRLRDNPLLRTALVAEQVGREADDADRIEALQTLLNETVERLEADPRDAKYHRALVRAYLKPAGTHERAAELLDLPYSTFRRHLTRGRARVAEILWQMEVGSL